MERIENVTVLTRANVYFEGKCVSHTIELADGTKKTVGVMLPATLRFDTHTPEIMQSVAGHCRYRIAGGPWLECGEGESFSVPGDSFFEVEVSDAPWHYICHF